MAGVRIVTDSACDLTDDEASGLGIEVVPLSIRFGSDEFEDRSELSAEAFYEKMDQRSELPETAAPSPGKFEAAFRRQAEAGADAVVCINLSSDLSATMAAAENAARAIADDLDVRVVDSKSITAGLGTQVLLAAQRAADGASADEVVDLFQRAAPTRKAGSIEEAARTAFELAPRPGTVLLAPACASWDMFRDYQERGDRFAAAARTIEKEVRT